MAHEQNNLHGAQGTEVDPVCGMDVDITSAAASHQHGAPTISAADTARSAFSKSPETFLSKAAVFISNLNQGY